MVRMTRTELLRELALKKKMEEKPEIYSKENGSIDSYRYRDKRGKYQRRRASCSASRSPKRTSSIARAEERLKVIEKISKYREDKIKKEFYRLEEELRQEQERV